MATLQGVRAAVLGRRHELGLSQAELARRVGVSRKWLSEFERGKASAELGLVLRVLDGLGLTLTIGRSEVGDEPEQAAVDLDSLLEEYRRGD